MNIALWLGAHNFPHTKKNFPHTKKTNQEHREASLSDTPKFTDFPPESMRINPAIRDVAQVADRLSHLFP